MLDGYLRQICLIALAGLWLMLSGCSMSAPEARTERVMALAQRWQPLLLPGDVFDVQAFVPSAARMGDVSGHLTVYIEGDGQAFIDHRTPAFTPTPSNPVALRLAMADPRIAGAVAYLGRPCQYTRGASFKNCATPYWGRHRFAPEIIEAMAAALDQLKQRTGATSITLVGYSGGAAVAVLLASQRHDVRQLVTIAGNLDTIAWVDALGLSPLSGSLNPADVASRLSALPQWHWIGGQDDIVPGVVLASYLRSAGVSSSGNERIRVTAVEAFDHHCCWAEVWPEFVAQMQQAR